jgi:hypothetical protein
MRDGPETMVGCLRYGKHWSEDPPLRRKHEGGVKPPLPALGIRVPVDFLSYWSAILFLGFTHSHHRRSACL